MVNRRRTPTDNTKALTHLVKKRLGLTILTSGHILYCPSSSADPVCQKPPTDRELDAMISNDIVEYYQEITANSCSPTPPAVFHKRAIDETADAFKRSSYGIKDVLRKAGLGRGKITPPSS